MGSSKYTKIDEIIEKITTEIKTIINEYRYDCTVNIYDILNNLIETISIIDDIYVNIYHSHYKKKLILVIKDNLNMMINKYKSYKDIKNLTNKIVKLHNDLIYLLNMKN